MDVARWFSSSDSPFSPGLSDCSALMLLLNPFFPFTAAKIASLQAAVLLLLTLLIKAKVQIKVASAVGLTLLALQTLVFLAVAGALGVAAVGAGGLAMGDRQASEA